MTEPADRRPGAYQQAGVDIDAKAGIIARIKQAATSTYTPSVIAGVGAFGGIFKLPEIGADAMLVASTDGVGTKTMLAAHYGRLRGLGHDIVNHSINDILCQGARPLFFMDYIAASHLDPAVTLELIEGMAEACRAAGCALLGGETAEMPGVYQSGQFDVVGTIVGLVQPADRLPAPDLPIIAGDVLIGLPSSGPHTNGYSLIRQVFSAGLPDSLIEAALAPHHSYLAPITAMRAQFPIKALAHITGGGVFDNLPRVLPDGLGAQIQRGSWPILPIFTAIAERGQIAEMEMFHVFNMGIGLIAVVAPDVAASILSAPRDLPCYRLGSITETPGVSLI